jgi:hypothetical protein
MKMPNASTTQNDLLSAPARGRTVSGEFTCVTATNVRQSTAFSTQETREAWE